VYKRQGRQIAEVKSKLQRMSPIEQGDEYHALFGLSLIHIWDDARRNA